MDDLLTEPGKSWPDPNAKMVVPKPEDRAERNTGIAILPRGIRMIVVGNKPDQHLDLLRGKEFLGSAYQSRGGTWCVATSTTRHAICGGLQAAVDAILKMRPDTGPPIDMRCPGCNRWATFRADSAVQPGGPCPFTYDCHAFMEPFDGPEAVKAAEEAYWQRRGLLEAVGKHFGTEGRPGPRVVSDPPWLLEKQTIELHLDGSPDCSHDFSPWDCTSGTAKVNRDGFSFITAWMKFESTCRKCPARVGRKMECALQDDGR